MLFSWPTDGDDIHRVGQGTFFYTGVEDKPTRGTPLDFPPPGVCGRTVHGTFSPSCGGLPTPVTVAPVSSRTSATTTPPRPTTGLRSFRPFVVLPRRTSFGLRLVSPYWVELPSVRCAYGHTMTGRRTWEAPSSMFGVSTEECTFWLLNWCDVHLFVNVMNINWDFVSYNTNSLVTSVGQKAMVLSSPWSLSEKKFMRC